MFSSPPRGSRAAAGEWAAELRRKAGDAGDGARDLCRIVGALISYSLGLCKDDDDDGDGDDIWLVVWNMNCMTFHILGIMLPTD